MSQNTPNYGLFKYEDNDTADLRFLSPTMDKIDTELKNNSDAIQNVTVPVTSVNAKTGDVVLKAENINNNDGVNLENKIISIISDLDNKINKPLSAISNNIAVFDSARGLIDSGKTTDGIVEDSVVTGSFSGNGSTVFVTDIGFKPRFVLVLPFQNASGNNISVNIDGSSGGFKTSSGDVYIQPNNPKITTNSNGFYINYTKSSVVHHYIAIK